MRSIVSIPTLHKPQESAATVESYKKYFEVRGSSNPLEKATLAVEGINNAADSYWDMIENNLEERKVDPKNMVIYAETTFFPLEDELPIFQRQTELGNRQSQLILKLLEQGARYEPAEDIVPFRQQGRITDVRLKVWLSELRAKENQHLQEQRQALGKKLEDEEAKAVEARDEHVAPKINRTLKEGEIGILLFGDGHNIEQFLDKDIEVISLRDTLLEARERVSEVFKELEIVDNSTSPESKG